MMLLNEILRFNEVILKKLKAANVIVQIQNKIDCP